VVPILRAGLGMLEGMQRLLPTAEVGFLGMIRNETTLLASTYAERLPEDLAGRQCYLLDPMLATGGTLAAAIEFLVLRGANHITAVTLLAAPEGIARLELIEPFAVLRGIAELRTRTAGRGRRHLRAPGHRPARAVVPRGQSAPVLP